MSVWRPWYFGGVAAIYANRETASSSPVSGSGNDCPEFLRIRRLSANAID